MLELVGSNYGDGSATTWRYSRSVDLAVKKKNKNENKK